MANNANERIVLSARVTVDPGWGGLGRVFARFETDGEEEELFSFYPDEIGFSPGEFEGKSVADAFEIYRKKDEAYLQS